MTEQCPICGFTPRIQRRGLMEVHMRFAHVEENHTEEINKAVDSGKLIENPNGTYSVPKITEEDDD